MTSLPVILQVLWRCGNDKEAGEDILGAIVVNLHTGSSGQVVVLHWTEEAVESNILLSDRADLLRTTLLDSVA